MPTTKKRYTYYLTITQADGTKKQLRFSSVNKKEAKNRRDQAKWEYEAGLLTFSKATTVAKYAEGWQDQLHLHKDDKSRLKRFCLDIIGSLEVGDVKATHIRDCFAKMNGLSKSTISKACNVIKRMFADMVADDLILRNPCDRVSRPTGTVKNRRAMTEEEETVFLSVLKSHIDDKDLWYNVIYGISYACGLRPGEARALQRDHVFLDVEHPYLSITQACKNKTTTIGPPKTKAGKRSVPIPAWFVPLLKQAMDKQKDTPWVVPNANGGTLSHETYCHRWQAFYRAMQQYAAENEQSFPDDKLTPYYLRHTYCTNLVYMRVPEIIAMRWMGHDDPNMIRKIYADANSTKILAQAIADLDSYDPLKPHTK